MRVGDFSVEVIGADGATHEFESGHVAARPGQVYVLRLRNHGPLRCVADVSIDGRGVTGHGLVIDAWRSVDLERPIHATERGRFTVVAEGDERVFGPDGGRDNAALGLITARFRRELPSSATRREMPPSMPWPERPPSAPPMPIPSRIRSVPPEYSPPENVLARRHMSRPPMPAAAVERAAGTGLTGHSDQRFVPFQLGPLESEATVIQLRIVIGTEAAIAQEAPRPLV